ncbi:hypothetical protein [Escherichia phage vB_EcoP_PAS7]|uniref:HNH nuclease domain-containing protein n=1 Tax=Escherichia phage vB_EcoP_PAS7 TaxID=3053875 RepID=A0AA51VJP7_9CAUD|nr:hypothetical protein [Escherichia phage vB_EcoP_PAS7]
MKGIEEYIALDPSSPTYLSWIKAPLRGRVKVGEPALISLSKTNYYRGKFQQKNLLAHRVVYYLATGIEPPAMLDHTDGNRQNNNPDNLRAVTARENNHNRHACKGYHWRSNRNHWCAQIHVDGKEIYLGSFQTEAEARAAYLEGKRIYHPSAPVHLLN